MYFESVGHDIGHDDLCPQWWCREENLARGHLAGDGVMNSAWPQHTRVQSQPTDWTVSSNAAQLNAGHLQLGQDSWLG